MGVSFKPAQQPTPTTTQQIRSPEILKKLKLGKVYDICASVHAAIKCTPWGRSGAGGGGSKKKLVKTSGDGVVLELLLLPIVSASVLGAEVLQKTYTQFVNGSPPPPTKVGGEDIFCHMCGFLQLQVKCCLLLSKWPELFHYKVASGPMMSLPISCAHLYTQTCIHEMSILLEHTPLK